MSFFDQACPRHCNLTYFCLVLRYKQYYPSNKIKQLKNFKCIIQNKFKTDIYLQLLSNYFFRATISVYSSLKRHYAYAPVSFVHTILLTPLLFILCMFKNFGVHEISSLRQIPFGPKSLNIFFQFCNVHTVEC